MEESDGDRIDSVSSASDDDDGSSDIRANEGGDDEDECLGEGECELCERTIRLTKHHLIPKTTWTKLEPRLVKVAAALQLLQRGEEEGQLPGGKVGGDNRARHQRSSHHDKAHQQQEISSIGTSDSLVELVREAVDGNSSSPTSTAADDVSPKKTVRRLLGATCLICRPCHSAVHDRFDEMTLALDYNTVDRLLEDSAIRKFAKWANRQRAGKYAVK